MVETIALPTVEFGDCGPRAPLSALWLHRPAPRPGDRNEDAEMTVVTTVANGFAETRLLPSTAVAWRFRT